MLQAGYSQHKVYLDPQDNRYVVQGNLAGRTAMMVVGTVARTTLDQSFAATTSLVLDSTSGTFGGSGGATGKTSESAKPVILELDARPTAPGRCLVEDIYNYMNAKRPTDPGLARGGELGSDFLIANKAVIDFGSGMIYLK